MAITYDLLATHVVESGGASSIEFTSIPQTYTNLVVKLSARGTSGTYAWIDTHLTLNNSTLVEIAAYGDGNNTRTSYKSTSNMTIRIPDNSSTASTFGNAEITIPNYTTSNHKAISADVMTENNATLAFSGIHVGVWANSSAVTSIKITGSGTNLSQHSTATLYGVKNTV